MLFPAGLLLLLVVIALIFIKPLSRLMGITARSVEKKLTTDYDLNLYQAELSNGDTVLFQSVLGLKQVFDIGADFNIVGEISGNVMLMGETSDVMVEWEPYEGFTTIKKLKAEKDIYSDIVYYYFQTIDKQ
ncbi:MAG: hypothetical protein DRQ39_10770 [Gammaproteobacteria bacterium]|nr:MAG: hypothetical protein DRQ39_10770 [Gammaproteobacteria bacterium]